MSFKLKNKNKTVNCVYFNEKENRKVKIHFYFQNFQNFNSGLAKAITLEEFQFATKDKQIYYVRQKNMLDNQHHTTITK